MSSSTLLLEQFREWQLKVSQISFPKIKDLFRDLYEDNVAKWHQIQYIPKLHEFQLQFDLHKQNNKQWRTTPSFDRKKQYENIDNLHRRVITIFKDFILSDIIDFRQYLKFTIDLQKLSTLLSKIQVLRFKNSQFNLIYFLFTADKRLIKLFIKIRQQILKSLTFQKLKYHPISTHNPAKYTDKYVYLDSIQIPANKWVDFITLMNFNYDQQFTHIAFQYCQKVSAVMLIEYILWLSNQKFNNSPSR